MMRSEAMDANINYVMSILTPTHSQPQTTTFATRLAISTTSLMYREPTINKKRGGQFGPWIGFVSLQVTVYEIS